MARLVDASLFWEILPDAGREMITGVGKIGGLYGRVHRQQPAAYDPSRSSRQARSGGILYRQGIAKISAFSRACNDDGIPIVWLQDISGFRHRVGGGEKPGSWVRLQRFLYKFDQHRTHDHRAPAQGVGRGLTRHVRPCPTIRCLQLATPFPGWR